MKTALIIEDQPSNIQVFCLLLTHQGYRVLEATTGKEAIEARNREIGPIDLILCDLTLPDTPGTKLARELVQSQPNAAVLIVSGTPQTGWSESERKDFNELRRERSDFLEKPFPAWALQKKIDYLTTKHSHAPLRARQY